MYENILSIITITPDNYRPLLSLLSPFFSPVFLVQCVAIKLLIPWQGQLQTLTTRSSAIAAETVPFHSTFVAWI